MKGNAYPQRSPKGATYVLLRQFCQRALLASNLFIRDVPPQAPESSGVPSEESIRLRAPDEEGGLRKQERQNADKGRKRFQALASWLERNGYDKAAGSLREEPPMTTLRLGLLDTLRKSIAITNAIENLIGTIQTVSRNMKRWRSPSMICRWTALGVVIAEKSFSRIKGHRQMSVLDHIILEANRILLTVPQMLHSSIHTCRPSSAFSVAAGTSHEYVIPFSSNGLRREHFFVYVQHVARCFSYIK